MFPLVWRTILSSLFPMRSLPAADLVVGYMGVPYQNTDMTSHLQYLTVRNERGQELLDSGKQYRQPLLMVGHELGRGTGTLLASLLPHCSNPVQLVHRLSTCLMFSLYLLVSFAADHAAACLLPGCRLNLPACLLPGSYLPFQPASLRTSSPHVIPAYLPFALLACSEAPPGCTAPNVWRQSGSLCDADSAG